MRVMLPPGDGKLIADETNVRLCFSFALLKYRLKESR